MRLRKIRSTKRLPRGQGTCGRKRRNLTCLISNFRAVCAMCLPTNYLISLLSRLLLVLCVLFVARPYSFSLSFTHTLVHTNTFPFIHQFFRFHTSLLRRLTLFHTYDYTLAHDTFATYTDFGLVSSLYQFGRVEIRDIGEIVRS